jgi:signal transduction histidine kinase
LAAERDALRRFIADASHELRTPITALKSFNSLLLGPASADTGAREEFLKESEVQIERLEQITADLLDLSRLDAGLVTLELGEHDVSELLDSVASDFRARAQIAGIALLVLAPDPPILLVCDRSRLALALTNLLDNALKFTPAGGEIEIGARREPASVALWVRDTGTGIDAGDLPHVFERFYRGRGAQGAGSGLGLAIVHSIVHAHGGQVSVESTPGEGSRFVIRLPQD